MLLERGIVFSYETVRRWTLKFGLDYARRLERKKPSCRDIWHLDEVVVAIGGCKLCLWRAVDLDGYILDEIVQTRRDTKAAKRLLTRLLEKQGCPPRRLITDKLGSYAAARRSEVGESEGHLRQAPAERAPGARVAADRGRRSRRRTGLEQTARRRSRSPRPHASGQVDRRAGMQEGRMTPSALAAGAGALSH